MSNLVERAMFLASGQDDPHSQTIIELCEEVKRLRRMVYYLTEDGPTPDRSGEADKTENTGLDEGESGLPEGSSKP